MEVIFENKEHRIENISSGEIENTVLILVPINEKNNEFWTSKNTNRIRLVLLLYFCDC